jgi:hypothetical protein
MFVWDVDALLLLIVLGLVALGLSGFKASGLQRLFYPLVFLKSAKGR